MANLYKSTLEASYAMNERNDCSVKAMAITTGLPYSEVHAAFKAAGRINRQGTYHHQFQAVLKHMNAKYGFTFENSEPRKAFTNKGVTTMQAYTPKTIGKAFPKGAYILHMKGHHAAMVDGQIEDWSEDKAKRIIQIWKVSR